MRIQLSSIYSWQMNHVASKSSSKRPRDLVSFQVGDIVVKSPATLTLSNSYRKWRVRETEQSKLIRRDLVAVI